MTALLAGDHLVKQFRVPGRRETLTAVDDVSLSVGRSEVVGLVGESGSGKSTVSRMLVGIESATSGSVLLGGRRVESRQDWSQLRSRVQYVFQDPYGSLAPHLSIGDTIGDPLVIRGEGTPAVRRRRVSETLEAVGLSAADAMRYPAVFSGGQRQRISLARALILKPELIICDEIVSGLDVSVQAQILNLLISLRSDFGVAYLFISHDLRVVKYLTERVIVMRSGRAVEAGQTSTVLASPQHAYTQQLVAAVPNFSTPTIPQPTLEN